MNITVSCMLTVSDLQGTIHPWLPIKVGLDLEKVVHHKITVQRL
jgi:hypothetical protein